MEERFNTFTVLIANINRCIRRIKAEEMAEFDLKGPHVSCLYYLYKGGALTAKELCDICREDKASISRSIKYLEEEGYLFCNSKLQKRYQSPLKLTEKGLEIGRHIEVKIDHILDVAGEGLSEAHRKILYHSLMLISENLNIICEKYEE